MRFHVVAPPHTKTAMTHSGCVFTMKTLHFCQMMKSLGHTVIHYGVEGSEVICDEHVQIMSKAEQEGFFGPDKPGITHEADWTGTAPYWALINDRAASKINQRRLPGDFVCLIMGVLNQPLAKAIVGRDALVVEYGCGYNGTFADYRVFESYAHMHKMLGAQSGFDPEGKFYDAVIPNYLNPTDYPLQQKKQDYYLYIGRLIQRKGVPIAVETCKRLGAKLKLAGPGVSKVVGNKIYCTDGAVYEGDNLEYVGIVNGAEKAALYGNAIATFVPTTYIEPFGAVVIESQMTGTPTITTDWGAFPEIVEHGKTGYRCHTLNEFVWAAKNVSSLNPMIIRNHAVANYGMANVRYKYQHYFTMLSDLFNEGWYKINLNQKNLNWLRKY